MEQAGRTTNQYLGTINMAKDLEVKASELVSALSEIFTLTGKIEITFNYPPTPTEEKKE